MEKAIDSIITWCECNGMNDSDIIDWLLMVFNEEELREWLPDFTKDYFEEED